MFQESSVLTTNKPAFTCISHKYHILFLWYTTLHVSTSVFTSESRHSYECEWPLLIVPYSHKPLFQSDIVWWFCMSCIVGIVLAVIYVFTTVLTCSSVPPNFLSNRCNGLFLWDEVSTTCPLFLCIPRLGMRRAVLLRHMAACRRGLVSVSRQYMWDLW
jgi:hypothetical protein